jgi:mRNA interferase ChpB
MRARAACRQGDIFTISLDPTIGTEIRGIRPVLILSNTEFNRNGRALVAPITQGGNWERVAGWAVPLMGSGSATQGVAVANQCRVLDLAARNAQFVERVSPEVIEDALAKLQAMIDVD